MMIVIMIEKRFLLKFVPATIRGREIQGQPLSCLGHHILLILLLLKVFVQVGLSEDWTGTLTPTVVKKKVVTGPVTSINKSPPACVEGSLPINLKQQ
jgi:hypothetical protein